MIFRGNNRAMTLIEVIIAISLVTMLMGVVYTSYIYAMDYRKSVSAEAAEVSSWRSMMQRMTSELRCAMIYPVMEKDDSGELVSRAFGLVGNNGMVRFVSARLPGFAAWARPGLIDGYIPPEPDVEQIQYRLRYDADTEQCVGLERISTKVLGLEKQYDESRVKLISDKVKLFFVRYYDGTSWINAWNGRGLPVAVDIWIGSLPAPEDLVGTDDQETVLEILGGLGASRRIIYIPSSTRSLAIISGSGARVPGAPASLRSGSSRGGIR